MHFVFQQDLCKNNTKKDASDKDVKKGYEENQH